VRAYSPQVFEFDWLTGVCRHEAPTLPADLAKPRDKKQSTHAHPERRKFCRRGQANNEPTHAALPLRARAVSTNSSSQQPHLT
jgi:hypothetical protein